MRSKEDSLNVRLNANRWWLGEISTPKHQPYTLYDKTVLQQTKLLRMFVQKTN